MDFEFSVCQLAFRSNSLYGAASLSCVYREPTRPLIIVAAARPAHAQSAVLGESTGSVITGAVLATVTPPAGSVEDVSCHPSAYRDVDLEERVRWIWCHHRPPEARLLSHLASQSGQCGVKIPLGGMRLRRNTTWTCSCCSFVWLDTRKPFKQGRCHSSCCGLDVGRNTHGRASIYGELDLSHFCVAPARWRVDSYREKVVVRLVVVRPRASRSSSHCNEQWEGRRVRHGTLGEALWFHAGNSTRIFESSSTGALSFIFLPLLSFLSFILSLLLRQQRAVDVAASLKLTVAASAERSRASFVEIGHGHSGTRFLASRATRRRNSWWFTS